MSLSEKILRGVKWFASVALLFFLLIIFLNGVIWCAVGYLPSSHPETPIGTFFLAANCALPIIGIILTVVFLVMGIPTYSRCPKCLCRFRWKNSINTGSDRSYPNEYEHSFEITECLICGKTQSLHFKHEKARAHRHDFDSRRNQWR